MKYFVSIENSNYFHWQIELLIESFKIQGLQNDLIIYIAESNTNKLSEKTCRNLIEHKNKFIHKNFGKNHLQSNRIYSLYSAINENLLGDEFVIIHSDMVLKNPIDKYNKSFNIVMNNNYEKDNLVEEFTKNENFICCMPIIFNDISVKFKNVFFNRLVLNLENIIKEKGPDFPCEKAAWKLTFLEGIGHYSITGNYLTCSLLYPDVDVPFIHYNHGIPPDFNKKLYKYFENPFESLLEMNPTESSNHFNKIIRSYLNK